MIGVFDSGSGGLTVLREIRARMPRADIVYFGDLQNAPYGNRTPEELGALTVFGFQRLLKEGATQIVSACNSVSANIVMPMFDILDIKPFDIVEMVGPTVRAFRGRRSERVLLIGTSATVRSGIYQNGFGALGMDIEAIALPHLAGAIEGGTSEPAIRAMLNEALEKRIGKYDTLILACTHFPLIRTLFEEKIGSAKIFDPAEVVAEEVVSRFGESTSKNGSMRLIISKDSPFFITKAEEFFEEGSFGVNVLS